MDINRCREESLTTMVRGTSRYTGESAAQVCWTASSGGLAENSWSALLLSLPAGPGPSLLCAVRPSSACVRASAGRCQQRTDLRAATPDPAIIDEWIYEPRLSLSERVPTPGAPRQSTTARVYTTFRYQGLALHSNVHTLVYIATGSTLDLSTHCTLQPPPPSPTHKYQSCRRLRTLS